MNAILRRDVSARKTENPAPDTSAGGLFGAGLGQAFESAFAIGVMLAALWLLASGYA